VILASITFGVQYLCASYRAGRPVAGINVVGNGFIAKQVQRDTGKLSATAAVAE
jgi:hypothetical protein